MQKISDAAVKAREEAEAEARKKQLEKYMQHKAQIEMMKDNSVRREMQIKEGNKEFLKALKSERLY